MHFTIYYFAATDLALQGNVTGLAQEIVIEANIPIMVFSDGIELTLIQLSQERSSELPNAQLPTVLSASSSCSPFLSQTATVDWTGGFCDLCQGVAQYSCNVPSPAFSDWNNGNKDFTDPLGSGITMSEVEVTIYGAISCGFATITPSINGTLVEQKSINDNCFCNDCESLSFTYSGDLAGYNYGGTNTLNISSGGVICLDYAEIELRYCEPCNLPCATFPYSN